MYGEIQNAKSLAETIVTARLNGPIVTVADLKNAISNRIPKGKENKYLAQVFQALTDRGEPGTGSLERFFDAIGRGAGYRRQAGSNVYHSLEDRLVKNFIAKGKFSGEVEKDLYGNNNKPFDAVSRGAITASTEEISNNNRARSAKLRIAVKNDQSFTYRNSGGRRSLNRAYC
jgi:16S rRNA (cytosine1402-N4)-methyltransferase